MDILYLALAAWIGYALYTHIYARVLNLKARRMEAGTKKLQETIKYFSQLLKEEE